MPFLINTFSWTFWRPFIYMNYQHFCTKINLFLNSIFPETLWSALAYLQASRTWPDLSSSMLCAPQAPASHLLCAPTVHLLRPFQAFAQHGFPPPAWACAAHLLTLTRFPPGRITPLRTFLMWTFWCLFYSFVLFYLSSPSALDIIDAQELLLKQIVGTSTVA